MSYDSTQPLTLPKMQTRIRELYGRKDAERGIEGTYMWLMEEIGELSAALREDDHEALAAEFADVLAWIATLANVADVDLSQAFHKKYGTGCPGCSQTPCICQLKP